MKSLIVNGETIDAVRIRQETAALAKLLAEQMPGEDFLAQGIRAREWAEENLIEEVLLRQFAALDPAAIEKVMAQVPVPRRGEILAYYQAHRNNFHSPEMVRAAHIVRNLDEQNDEATARATIERAQREIAAGRRFGQVADELSDCPGRGGDLGFFPRGQMVQAFDDAVFPLKTGQTTGIFRSEFGFHIAKVLDRRPEGIQPFDLVRNQIEQHLTSEMRQAAMFGLIDGLRAKADIRRVKDQGSA